MQGRAETATATPKLRVTVHELPCLGEYSGSGRTSRAGGQGRRSGLCPPGPGPLRPSSLSSVNSSPLHLASAPLHGAPGPGARTHARRPSRWRLPGAACGCTVAMLSPRPHTHSSHTAARTPTRKVTHTGALSRVVTHGQTRLTRRDTLALPAHRHAHPDPGSHPPGRPRPPARRQALPAHAPRAPHLSSLGGRAARGGAGTRSRRERRPHKGAAAPRAGSRRQRRGPPGAGVRRRPRGRRELESGAGPGAARELRRDRQARAPRPRRPRPPALSLPRARSPGLPSQSRPGPAQPSSRRTHIAPPPSPPRPGGPA